jgi:hypothetical protein|tara:strand:+ start:1475 stop:1699 length:225 start_codon:yes stop_codon:yes gene_type:complete
MPNNKKRGDNVASSRSRGGNKKDNKTKQQQGVARENDFINFLINQLGDIEDVSISINGDKRIPIKDLKKKIKKS